MKKDLISTFCKWVMFITLVILIGSSLLTPVYANTTTFVSGYMIVNNKPNLLTSAPVVSEGTVVSVSQKVLIGSNPSTPESSSYYLTNVGKIQYNRLNNYSILTPTIYKTTRTDVPVWSQPQSSSIIKSRIASIGSSVVIIGVTINSSNNLWYKTNLGYWIYSGNLAKSYYQINTGEVQHTENQYTNKTYVFSEQLNNSVKTGTCTLASYANMMRRYEIIFKNTSYLLTKKENEINNNAWGKGLRWTINANQYTPNVKMVVLTGTVSEKRMKLINYLKTRPEGIVVYTGYHAVLLTDFDPIKNIFYAYDSAYPTKPTLNEGRVPFTSVLKGFTTESDKINALNQIWIVY